MTRSSLAALQYIALCWFLAGTATGAVSDTTILAFGDSLTFGIGGTGRNYPDRLAQLLNTPVINAGLPGEITAEGLARLPIVLDEEKPGLIITCLGTNDLLRSVAIDEIRRNLNAMAAIASARDIPMLIIAVPDPKTGSAHPLFSELDSAEGIYVDNDALVSTLQYPLNKADLVHLNGEGYTQLALRLAQTLASIGWTTTQ